MSGAVVIHGFALDGRQAADWARGVQTARAGDMNSAVAIFQRLLAEQPHLVPAAVQLSHYLMSLKRYREARMTIVYAAHHRFESPELLLEVAKLLRHFEEPQALAECVRAAVWVTSRSGRLLGEIAVLLAQSGLYAEASEVLAHASAVDPEYPHLHYLQGAISMFAGDYASSRLSLERALALEPGLAHAQWMLSTQPLDGPLADVIERVTKALQTVGEDAHAEAYLSYALHNWLHRAGRHEEAWFALERACRAKKSTAGYRRTDQIAVFDALHAYSPSAGREPLEPAATRLIFIVGMHRSGTSLVERVLAAHPDVVDGGETYVFPGLMRWATDHDARSVIDIETVSRAAGQDLADAGRRMRTYAAWRSGGAAWLTEKLPSNFLHLGFILQALPDAKVLHLRRDPMDTCFSNLRTFFSGAAPYSYDQEDLADYYLRYSRLMRYWRDVAPGRILDVDYERFVDEPAAQTRRILDFCGLAAVNEMALHGERPGGLVTTASSVEARAGILKDRGGAWRNYAHHLGPLQASLAAGSD